MYLITDIEDAFLARCNRSRRLKRCAPWPPTAESCSSMRKPAPNVSKRWCSNSGNIRGLDGAEVERVNQEDIIIMHLTVLVCDRNLRGEEAARRGSPGSSGVYVLLEECRNRLHRQFLLTGWTQAVLEDEQPLAYDPQNNLAVYAARYVIKRAI